MSVSAKDKKFWNGVVKWLGYIIAGIEYLVNNL